VGRITLYGHAGGAGVYSIPLYMLPKFEKKENQPKLLAEFADWVMAPVTPKSVEGSAPPAR